MGQEMTLEQIKEALAGDGWERSRRVHAKQARRIEPSTEDAWRMPSYAAKVEEEVTSTHAATGLVVTLSRDLVVTKSPLGCEVAGHDDQNDLHIAVEGAGWDNTDKYMGVVIAEVRKAIVWQTSEIFCSDVESFPDLEIPTQYPAKDAENDSYLDVVLQNDAAPPLHCKVQMLASTLSAAYTDTGQPKFHREVTAYRTEAGFIVVHRKLMDVNGDTHSDGRVFGCLEEVPEWLGYGAQALKLYEKLGMDVGIRIA